MRRSVSIGGASSASHATGTSRNGQPPAGPKYYRRERSSRRAFVLAGAAAIVAVLTIALLLSASKGGSSRPPSGARSTHVAEGAASSPAETSVTVLNGTSTPGLAHHLAADLQQSGYTLAAAATGAPGGEHTATVVEYARGHRADARAVAKDLRVSGVEPLDASVAALSGSASVVVIAGSDQAGLSAEPTAGGASGAVEATPAA
jgi:uncharacterized protein (DUF2336 family)